MWRVGRKVHRTIYLDDRLVGLLDTPELASQAVDALNSAAGKGAGPAGLAQHFAYELQQWMRNGDVNMPRAIELAERLAVIAGKWEGSEPCPNVETASI